MELKPNFAFTRINYLLMLGGIGLLAIGFFIMTLDTEAYGFGFYGLTLGPLIVMAGFLIQFIAIFIKGKPSGEAPQSEKE
ncbi:MAG: DUF3098 domain-containing protein [Cyclobacteriaceae bacterium]|nr:DUF3098 domain-containing protein [Cyclobacteriaceae bacterium]